jgi:hypothetical protein
VGVKTTVVYVPGSSFPRHAMPSKFGHTGAEDADSLGDVDGDEAAVEADGDVASLAQATRIAITTHTQEESLNLGSI